jgi:glycosyltransferase involved in cell wall biosynthesis
MNILMIAINDPAGTAIAFTKAINRLTEHTCRLITKEIRYNFMFENDLHLPWFKNGDWDKLEFLLKDSDIFHFHMTADDNIKLGPFKVHEYVRGKQIIHHHHGHPDFRSNPNKYRAKYMALKRRKLIVSTPDLLKFLPEARWVPNLVPLNDQLYTQQDVPENGKVIIGQSPTRQDLKNTSDLSDVVNKLRRKITESELELDVITNTSHKECLKRKRNCHIIFDHMQGYFGVSSLESLSQGKPVIAGLDDWNCKHIKNFTGTDEIPWVIAGDNLELQRKLEMLIAEPQLKESIGAKSRKFMETCWTEEHILESLLSLYQKNEW